MAIEINLFRALHRGSNLSEVFETLETEAFGHAVQTEEIRGCRSQKRDTAPCLGLMNLTPKELVEARRKFGEHRFPKTALEYRDFAIKDGDRNVIDIGLNDLLAHHIETDVGSRFLRAYLTIDPSLVTVDERLFQAGLALVPIEEITDYQSGDMGMAGDLLRLILLGKINLDDLRKRLGETESPVVTTQ